MARTLLLRMASGVGTPAAELILRSTRVVAETVTLVEGNGSAGNPKRDYTGTIGVGTAAGTYDINLKSGASYIGGDAVIIAATDGVRYDADSVRLDLSGTTVGLIDGAITDAKFTVPAVSGVATGIVGKIDQLWRRFFKKATKTSTQIKTYADNGTDVVTTQTVSDSSGTETQGAAS